MKDEKFGSPGIYSTDASISWIGADINDLML